LVRPRKRIWVGSKKVSKRRARTADLIRIALENGIAGPAAERGSP